MLLPAHPAVTSHARTINMAAHFAVMPHLAHESKERTVHYVAVAAQTRFFYGNGDLTIHSPVSNPNGTGLIFGHSDKQAGRDSAASAAHRLATPSMQLGGNLLPAGHGGDD